ncbi:MAG: adenylate/guanylate cyclase domain-containing protein, partial [Kiloniellales bacterium]
MERRLTTILAADVVGYSRLMGEDEAGTLVALKAHREAAINPKIAAHNGRIVKLMGDGLLTEFASVVEAVACAVEIQGAMAERNAEVPEDRRIQFRIGINVGDVMVEGDDIYGDGVNIAARLEGLAEPGGICVARNVFNQVKGKIDTAFEDLGEKEVKNIAEPVQVYRVSLSLPETAALKTGKTAPTLALPDKPSIAVLPFDNMSGDPDQAYFSDGMTEDIITELARFRSLFVIARNSSFAFRDRTTDVAEIGRQLGVQYVVEGSVRKAGNRVRVTAQLIDAATANHIWAERYDRDLDDIFAVQDEVVRTVVATLAGRLEQAGRESAKQKPPSNLGAYDFFLRGRNHFYHMTCSDNRTAQEMFAKAIELDPGYAPAHAGLAKSNFLDWFGGWSADLQASRQRGVALAEKAVALDDTDSR